MKVRTFAALALVSMLLLAFAAPALAASPEQSAYGGPCGSNSNLCKPNQLPFTGIDTGIVVVLGLGLMGAGLVVRRGVRTGKQ